MGTVQQKMVREPVLLEEIHSSGRCMGLSGYKHVYLESGIPGETVSFTMGRRKQGFYSGKVEEILVPSPHRISPFCKHYLTCGGCPWQHIHYAHQLELKHRILRNALEKYGIATPVIPPVIASPETVFYRHRMEYAFTSAAFHEVRSQGQPLPALGFHVNGQPGKVTAIEECHLQAEPARTICKYTEAFTLERGMDFYNQENKTGFLRSMSLRVNQAGEVLVLIGLASDNPPLRDELLAALLGTFPQIVSACYTIHVSPVHSQVQGEIIPFGASEPFIYETFAGYRFRIHASSFFQPNVKQAEQILITARNWAALSGYEKVYDLYTGVGSIALFLAPYARHVTGIEGSPLAINDATENARLSGIHNAEFLTGDILDTFKPAFLELHGKPGLIVLDPPRSGTLIEIKKTINTSGAEKVLYLSCNPVSLAFDLKQLTEVYRVTRIQPFDMLPQTQHLETLVLLERI
jgi:23S rRNA (uracil1939-C5)-methyltransferase